jgi:hypothetical protein
MAIKEKHVNILIKTTITCNCFKNLFFFFFFFLQFSIFIIFNFKEPKILFLLLVEHIMGRVGHESIRASFGLFGRPT